MPARPVSRRRVGAGLLIALLVVAAIVVLSEALRHPLPTVGQPLPDLPVVSADPRGEVICETPEVREGQARTANPSGAGPGEPGQVRTVSSNQLYDCPQAHDGQTVRYRGEVIGAVLQRDDGAWVFLNDDVYGDELGPLPIQGDFHGGNAGVGVHLPPEAVQLIEFVGGPQTQGDVLEVVGTFHRVDPTTREVTVIRAATAEVAVPGGPFANPPLGDRQAVALILAPLALAAVIAERVAARRR